MSVYPRILPVGEAAFTVEFGDAVDAALNRRVHALDAHLRARSVPGLVETVPTYRSLLVTYNPQVSRADAMRNVLTEALASQATVDAPEGRLVEIPVHYGGTCGPDLADVAAHCGLTEQAVIELHAQPVYAVAMLGFAPGFAYLLGLPETLATPRLTTPRLRVPPGSVGIAGAQTGVYALETPGGWRIIGRTDLALFDLSREAPFALQAGDRVRFIPL
jgi:inhibitor of KinA